MTWNDYMKEHGAEEYRAWDVIVREIRNRAFEEAAALFENQPETAQRILDLRTE